MKKFYAAGATERRVVELHCKDLLYINLFMAIKNVIKHCKIRHVTVYSRPSLCIYAGYRDTTNLVSVNLRCVSPNFGNVAEM